MPRVRVGGLDIAYESMGEGQPLVLIMGLGAQLVYWPEPFCRRLARRGFRVIRFDHRDCGLSSKLEQAETPRPARLVARWLLGQKLEVPYTLLDMADDVAGLLDALEIDKAHVVGASMGGMIAQTMAIAHPSRLRTLTSMMSHTGDRRCFIGHARVMRLVLSKAPRNRRDAIERMVEFYCTAQGRLHPINEHEIRRIATVAYDRCFYPRGFARHLAAIFATPSRTAALGFVRVPTLVIHGTDDPLVRPSCARLMARAVPGARLELIEGMGHGLAPGVWPRLVDAIAAHAARG